MKENPDLPLVKPRLLNLRVEDINNSIVCASDPLQSFFYICFFAIMSIRFFNKWNPKLPMVKPRRLSAPEWKILLNQSSTLQRVFNLSFIFGSSA